MGNQICCQQTTAQEHKEQMIYNSTGFNLSGEEKHPNSSDINYDQLVFKRMTPQIRAVVQEYKPFQKEFSNQDDVKFYLYGNDLYEGPIDMLNRPCKVGKMYKENGAYFIGNFVSGKANGPCFYAMSNGSFYQGLMKGNNADCENGEFSSKVFEYKGGFKDNLFHGKGTERTYQNNYSFEGIYQENKKKQGVMKWVGGNHEYIYEGSFDKNSKYTGKGKLVDPQGRYEGDFVNGQKHGFGIYQYKTQLRYEGLYAHNKKQGQGKLFNNDNTIAYKGVFKNGMPNGKGIGTSKNGSEFQTEWIDGIDARLL